MELSWQVIKDFLIAFGWVKGTLTIFFWLAHFWIFRQYNARLKDKQEQINELAAENREYRERYLALMDSKMGYDVKQLGKQSPKQRLKQGGVKPKKGA